MMHFHQIYAKMSAINEISAKNNPHTTKFSSQNGLQGRFMASGVPFLHTAYTGQFLTLLLVIITISLAIPSFRSSAVRYKIHTSIWGKRHPCVLFQFEIL